MSVVQIYSTSYLPNSADLAATLTNGVLTWNLGSNALGLASLAGGGAATTITSAISQGSDDSEQEGPNGIAPGAPRLGGTDLELITDSEVPIPGDQVIGLRFTGLALPKNATILNAYLTFRAVTADPPNTNTGVTNLTIKGQAADNPTTFTTALNNISSRPQTTATVLWSALPVWSAGTNYTTPALNTIVQELVNRPGWNSGNSMAFVITGSGSRSAEAFEDVGTNPPRLTIVYTPASRRNMLMASPRLVTAGNLFTVAQVVFASYHVTNVTPAALTITGINGVYATLVGGPTPASATVGPLPTTFTWVYRATANGNIGQLIFARGASANGVNLWPVARSNSMIILPPLTFQVTVNNPATVNPVQNMAHLRDASGALPPSPSNIAATILGATIGDRVWADVDGDGLQDSGEPGLRGVQWKVIGWGCGAGTLQCRPVVLENAPSANLLSGELRSLVW